MRIAIDAMGGDHAPEEIVRGVVEAASLVPDASLVLVGQQERIEKALGGNRPASVEIHHASEVIEMHEDPARGLRGKPDSSLRIGLELVKGGRADGIISAGNTGALVGGATVPLLGLGTLEGVKRAGICVPIPTEKGYAALIDAGANKNAKAEHLVQYAIMGSVYIRYLREDISNPRVGLLNIGEERNKGTVLHQETYELLQKANVNFVGNIEPHKVFSGKADVVVSDGFTGNIFLKALEGMSNFLMGQIRSNGLASSPDVQKGVERAEQKTDYTAVGGAPVLGVRGLVLKCHGRSKAKAVCNAVRLAAGFIKGRLNDRIVSELRQRQLGGRSWFSGWFGKTPKGEPEEA